MLKRENPGSSGLVGCMGPPPASRQAAVDRSHRIKSGMKMSAISVRLVSGAVSPVLGRTRALMSLHNSGLSAYLRKTFVSSVGLLRL